MDSTSASIVLVIQWLAGIAAFFALMQLFPICIRLRNISSCLKYLVEERDRARRLSGDPAVWDSSRSCFIDPRPEDTSWYRESPTYKETTIR